MFHADRSSQERLFLAGEATSIEHFPVAHGAHFPGVSAASILSG
jgi:hypothetical protein